MIGVLLSWRFWEELGDNNEALSTTVRNVGLVIGGVIAILLAVWRSTVAARQVDTAQQSLLNERYERGAEMLGNGVLSVRLGGIYALNRLAQEHPEQYHLQISRKTHQIGVRCDTAKSKHGSYYLNPGIQRVT